MLLTSVLFFSGLLFPGFLCNFGADTDHSLIVSVDGLFRQLSGCFKNELYEAIVVENIKCIYSSTNLR